MSINDVYILFVIIVGRIEDGLKIPAPDAVHALFHVGGTSEYDGVTCDLFDNRCLKVNNNKNIA